MCVCNLDLVRGACVSVCAEGKECSRRCHHTNVHTLSFFVQHSTHFYFASYFGVARWALGSFANETKRKQWNQSSRNILNEFYLFIICRWKNLNVRMRVIVCVCVLQAKGSLSVQNQGYFFYFFVFQWRRRRRQLRIRNVTDGWRTYTERANVIRIRICAVMALFSHQWYRVSFCKRINTYYSDWCQRGVSSSRFNIITHYALRICIMCFFFSSLFFFHFARLGLVRLGGVCVQGAREHIWEKHRLLPSSVWLLLFFSSLLLCAAGFGTLVCTTRVWEDGGWRGERMTYIFALIH